MATTTKTNATIDVTPTVAPEAEAAMLGKILGYFDHIEKLASMHPILRWALSLTFYALLAYFLGGMLWTALLGITGSAVLTGTIVGVGVVADLMFGGPVSKVSSSLGSVTTAGYEALRAGVSGFFAKKDVAAAA